MKIKTTISIDKEVLEKMRDFVEQYPEFTLSGICEEAFIRVLHEIKKSLGDIPKRLPRKSSVYVDLQQTIQ